MFKPKTVDTPATDWIDQNAVKALQDQAEAALKINEPVERLVALKNTVATIETRLTETTIRSMLSEGMHLKASTFLTPAGRQLLQKRTNKQDIATWVAIPVGLGMCLGVAMLPVAVFGAGFFSVCASIALGPANAIGIVSVAEKLAPRFTSPVRKEVDAVAELFDALLARLQGAIADIENTLTLAEARESTHLDAALDMSPSLQTRFAAEATRASIKGDAKPEDIRIITKPARRDIAL